MNQGMDLSHLVTDEEKSNSLIIEATDASFQEIVELSKKVPVVIDLWADWCAPCKTLGPILEKVTNDYAGRLILAKIDVDSNPGLARAFNAQSIPTVVALVNGQPVPLFQGALPEAQVREYYDKLLELAAQHGVTGRIDADALENDVQEEKINPLHEKALDALEAGDYETAVHEYQKVVTNHPGDDIAKEQLSRSKLFLRLNGADAAAIRNAAAANPSDVDAGLLAADLDTSGGHIEDAFLRVLDLFADCQEDDKTRVREHLLELFTVVGNSDPRVAKARLKLANLLF